MHLPVLINKVESLHIWDESEMIQVTKTLKNFMDKIPNVGKFCMWLNNSAG